jgi:tRNA uridine 5-carbamoylmethylation protein Kti12
MDVSKSYAMTPRSLKETTQWLNEEAQSLQAKSGNLSDSSALQKLAREFVKRISKVSSIKRWNVSDV